MRFTPFGHSNFAFFILILQDSIERISRLPWLRPAHLAKVFDERFYPLIEVGRGVLAGLHRKSHVVIFSP